MPYQSRPQKQVDAHFVRLSILVPAAMSTATAWICFRESFDLTVIYTYLRLTGWGMLGTFLCSFGASTLQHFFPSRLSKTLINNRKYFGLAFAVFITFHFYGLYLKMDYDPVFFFQDLTIPEFILGIIAIFFTIAMTFTSSAAMQQKIGPKRWAFLHTWGGNSILFAFWITYSDHGLNQLPIFLIINILIILRCIRRFQSLRSEKPHNQSHLILTITVGLILALACAFVFQQVRSRGGPAVNRDRIYNMRDYFPLFDQKTWTYQSRTNNGPPEKVSYRMQVIDSQQNAKRYELSLGNTQKLIVGLDNYGIRMHEIRTRNQTLNFDPPGIYLPHLYQFEKKSFTTSLHSTTTDDSPGQAEFDYRLANIETLVSPQENSISCLVIEYNRKFQVNANRWNVVEGRLYLAPGIGLVKETRLDKIMDANNAIIRQREVQLVLVDAPFGKW